MVTIERDQSMSLDEAQSVSSFMNRKGTRWRNLETQSRDLRQEPGRAKDRQIQTAFLNLVTWKVWKQRSPSAGC